jgi:hypothetical protein
MIATITIILIIWIGLGLFVDYKRNGYDLVAKRQLGWTRDAPCRWTAFILAPFNFAYILIKKFIKTIITDEWD